MRYKEATTGCWPFWLGGAVVAIAMGVMVVGRVGQHGHWLSHRNSMQEIELALKFYQEEYFTWPDDPVLVRSDVAPVKVRGLVLDSLFEDNPRGIRFFSPSSAKPGHRPGLVREEGVSAMHDIWGSCYFLMLDMNGDGQVKNPERLPGAVPNPRAKPLGEFLPMRKAIFSAGPDRDPNTWADNITSWR